MPRQKKQPPDYSWIDNDPEEGEVKSKEEGERTIRSIPYEIIKPKLDRLCPDGWDTKNFHHLYFYMPDKSIKVSGSIEVVVKYGNVNRTLSGAATFYAQDYYPNEHWAATVKSLAVVNAVQVLGKNFGWGLNPMPEMQSEERQKQPIDAIIQKKLELAISKGDEKTVNEIKENYVI